MSKLHSELEGTEVHPPKGFETAGNETILVKDSTGNLVWTAKNGAQANDKQRMVLALNEAKTVTILGDSILENAAGIVARLESMFTSATFTNSAVGGYTSKDIIDNMASYVATPPDTYIIGVGLNDIRYNDARGAITQAAYITNMTSIINSLKATGADVHVISIWPSFWEDQFAALLRKETDLRMSQYNTELSRTCFSLGAGYIETQKYIRKNFGPFNTEESNTDGVHPSGNGIDVYTDSMLSDHTRELLTNAPTTGSHFFKWVIEDHEVAEAGGFLGLRNIGVVVTDYKVMTANLSYDMSLLFGPYDATTQAFNKANDWPLNIVFATTTYPANIPISSLYSGTGFPRGPKAYTLYYSTNAEALNDCDHPSWEPVTRQIQPVGTAVNIIPSTRNGVFYRFSTNDATSPFQLKSLTTETAPIRCWVQNVIASSARRFAELFNGTITLVADALIGNVPGYSIIWEAETILTTVEIASFNTLGAWTIHKSFNPAAMEDFAHPSWALSASGTGNGTANLT